MSTTSDISGIAKRYDNGSVSSSIVSESSESQLKGSQNTMLPNAIQILIIQFKIL